MQKHTLSAGCEHLVKILLQIRPTGLSELNPTSKWST